MKKLLFTTLIAISCTMCIPSYAADNRKSGFGFGMGTATPERSGRSAGWGFGSVDDYDQTEDGIEQSSASGGMSWRDDDYRYRHRRPFFSLGSRRNHYGPPPPPVYGPPPGWGYYPPPYYQYPQPGQQPQPDTEEK
jgi:hypothetical protein